MKDSLDKQEAIYGESRSADSPHKIVDNICHRTFDTHGGHPVKDRIAYVVYDHRYDCDDLEPLSGKTGSIRFLIGYGFHMVSISQTSGGFRRQK